MPPYTLGPIAASFTSLSFLPQVIKLFKTRSVKSISARMYTMNCTGQVLWIIYGLWIKAYPVAISSAIAFILASSILLMKLCYKE